MASSMTRPVVRDLYANGAGSAPRGHARAKSSILKSFIHRRNNSDGTALPPSLSTPAATGQLYHDQLASSDSVDSTGLPIFAGDVARALGELQQNQQDQASRSPRRLKNDRPPKTSEDCATSPSKTGFATLKSIASRDGGRLSRAGETLTPKPKKTKSSTNLAGLLARPKSFRNLQKLAAQDAAREAKDKENQKPPNSATTPDGNSPPPPIYAQFSRKTSFDGLHNPSSNDHIEEKHTEEKPQKLRPKSFHAYYMSKSPKGEDETKPTSPKKSRYPAETGRKASTTNRITSKTHRGQKLTSAITGIGHKKVKSATAASPEPHIDPKDIDTHLEAMLDRRNIPENQRYKMRNLNSTIKMEFIRQDWAEMQAAKNSDRPRTNDSDTSMDMNLNSAVAAGSDYEEHRPKRERGRSFTLSRGSKDKDKELSSPTKKSKGEGTIGRHFRSKSSDSVGSDRPSSAGSSSSTSILSKIKLSHGPGDFVSYLRKVQKPELVEVGKLHKLRLLLRNETVAWTEEFIQQGGMKEIVGLLNRILEVEWREEHEDALLHENLLCLKALCTTALALQYLHSIRDDLFPKIIFMLFDPEKKGPSEFTTRDIVISILFTYIRSATLEERVSRAKTVQSYLRDPEPKEEERPVPFVLEMRRERPYRVWCKEVVNVTKEVFWIFLHSLNVVALASDKSASAAQADAITNPTAPGATLSGVESGHLTFMSRHFPQERPLVPAAPYVGGVEWDATNYLASHVELMNAIIACTPTAVQRNALRAELRISGWERCLGGSLRLCKEKFYPGVHDGLRTWVAAAAEDGWDVRDVRYGPPPEATSTLKKTGGGQKKKCEDAPKIEMPKLELGLDNVSNAARDAWL